MPGPSLPQLSVIMIKSPLVSVCVPTYNYGRFLSDCIESVLTQTLSDWELIICDDCSTDNTAEISRDFLVADSRIRYLRNERRLGMNGNMKRAAEHGRGKYLKMLCSDDWLAPDCLKVLSELLEKNPQAVIATSAETLSDEKGQPIQIQFLFGEPVSIIDGAEMLDRMSKGHGFGGNSSFLIRRSAYKDVDGYDDGLLYAADYDLAARLCRSGSYLHVDLPLFYGRIQPQSSSCVDPNKLFDVMDAFEIPAKVFHPRRFGNKEWRRYQRLTGSLTARYLVNLVLQYLRGERSYAGRLVKLLVRRGNFLLGIPLLVVHIPMRIYGKLTGKNKPLSLPAGEVVGIPTLSRISSE